MRRRTSARLRQLVRNGPVASEWVPRTWRVRALRRPGVDVGWANIYPGVTILGTGSLRIGHNSMINRGCVIDVSADVSIGADVHLGHQVLVVTSTHDLVSDARRRAGPRLDRAVSIGDGAWLGARTTVLPGVVIGAGSVVAAGALVSSDVPPDSLYGGVPARLLRQLPV